MSDQRVLGELLSGSGLFTEQCITALLVVSLLFCYVKRGYVSVMLGV